jgi:hypothetical protein
MTPGDATESGDVRAIYLRPIPKYMRRVSNEGHPHAMIFLSVLMIFCATGLLIWYAVAINIDNTAAEPICEAVNMKFYRSASDNDTASGKDYNDTTVAADDSDAVVVATDNDDTPLTFSNSGGIEHGVRVVKKQYNTHPWALPVAEAFRELSPYLSANDYFAAVRIRRTFESPAAAARYVRWAALHTAPCFDYVNDRIGPATLEIIATNAERSVQVHYGQMFLLLAVIFILSCGFVGVIFTSMMRGAWRAFSYENLHRGMHGKALRDPRNVRCPMMRRMRYQPVCQRAERQTTKHVDVDDNGDI